MDTLILKCSENAVGENLRGMNELRIRCISQGTGVKRVNLRPTQSDGTYKGKIQYRVLSGAGHLTDSAGIDKGIEYDVQNYAGVIVPSGESVVQIKNFDIMTDVIGYDGFCFISSPDATNYPAVVLDLKEVKNKTFLKQIYLDNAAQGYYESEDIAELANLTEMIYFKATPYTNLKCGGNLASLHNLTNLVTFMPSPIYNKRVSFKYCIDDLISMTSLVNCEILGGTFTGGDVFALLSNKSRINYILDRFESKTGNFTCSYISGTSTIPTFVLKDLELSYNLSSIYAMSVADAKALLTLIKDGINANKITLESGAAVKIGLTSAADSALNTLASEVTALGATVNLRS